MRRACVNLHHWFRRRRVLPAASACILVAVAIPAGWAADSSSSSVDKVKAAYIFNFAKFVDWPNWGAADVLMMCFMGDADVYRLLAHDVNGTLIGQRRVVVRSLGITEPVGSCNLLYMDHSVASLPGILSVASLHALTVSDLHDFTRHGGAIELFTDGNRLRFKINVGNARAAGLRISSQLQQLASNVEQE